MNRDLRRALLVAGTGLVGLGISGCVTRERVVYTSAPPPPPPGPVVVQEDVVVDAPPAAVYEEVGVAPYPGAFWIRGHYYRDRGRWVWYRGYWGRRPHPGAVWVDGRWGRRGGGYFWVEGYWR